MSIVYIFVSPALNTAHGMESDFYECVAQIYQQNRYFHITRNLSSVELNQTAPLIMSWYVLSLSWPYASAYKFGFQERTLVFTREKYWYGTRLEKQRPNVARYSIIQLLSSTSSQIVCIKTLFSIKSIVWIL